MMSDDRFKNAGQFEPKRAWSEIQRKDWEAKTESQARGGGWLAFGLFICLLLIVIGLGSFLFGLPQLLGNIF